VGHDQASGRQAGASGGEIKIKDLVDLIVKLTPLDKFDRF